MTEKPDPAEVLPPDAVDDPLTDHEYDGIREYDNPTPGWWNMLFLATFIFSLAYILIFHIGVGPSVHDNYEAASVSRMRQMFGEIGDLEPDRATIVSYMDDEQWLQVGESVYTSRCATCHGSEGNGTAAPNLTDDLWIHVKNIEDIAKVVSNGANNGNMPAWKAQLHINEIVLVSSYVANMRGRNLPTGNWGGAAGQEIPPWPTDGD
jgi:cytochrome c oxidase cbb3-type subunit 3